MSIDFAKHLNQAQLEAVCAIDGPVLVVAGAGSGKTRTIVYRLAHLILSGVDPMSILLLTFTRKAAREMLDRAESLLGMRLLGAGGGTFHSFAYAQLRRNAHLLGLKAGLSIIDRTDAEGVLSLAKTALGLTKKDRSFPKNGTILELISKSRNKEISLDELLEQEAFHLLAHKEAILELSGQYAEQKESLGLLDYDDLLFKLAELMVNFPEVVENLRARFQYIMVDEYQDTNLVQARLSRMLAGPNGNIMAVGDDAQSIYAFRGANVENILNFEKDFPQAKIIRLEQNYRSTQPILNFTNNILAQALKKHQKNLYTEREGGPVPFLYRTRSDLSQAEMVLNRIRELAKTRPLEEIAVLFRASYQSYPLEIALGKSGIGFTKYGGAKFSEAAHIKDACAYLRILFNPQDLPAWVRVLSHIHGVGERTIERIFTSLSSSQNADLKYLDRTIKKHPELREFLGFIESLRLLQPCSPLDLMEKIVSFHTPFLARKYPDDYPSRIVGLEYLVQISSGYGDLPSFLADLTLETPEYRAESSSPDSIVLSTVHSAKGLEWSAVCLIDLVDERFPSRHALNRDEELEEERRLLYVACTRAKDELHVFVPKTVYVRGGGYNMPVNPSQFLRTIPEELYQELREDSSENLGWEPKRTRSRASRSSRNKRSETPAQTAPPKLGFCQHKIFGPGKIVDDLGGRYRVNFPGFGLKVILAEYLTILDNNQEGESNK